MKIQNIINKNERVERKIEWKTVSAFCKMVNIFNTYRFTFLRAIKLKPKVRSADVKFYFSNCENKTTDHIQCKREDYKFSAIFKIFTLFESILMMAKIYLKLRHIQRLISFEVSGEWRRPLYFLINARTNAMMVSCNLVWKTHFCLEDKR